VHSLVTLLCLYSVRLNFVAPASLRMPSSVVSAAKRAGVAVHQCEALEDVLAETDVLYVTRVQKERFSNEAEWSAVKDAYRVDHALLSRAKEDMIVMHPLPRVNGKPDLLIAPLHTNSCILSHVEIDPEVDFDSRRAVYFRQMRYGLFVSLKPRVTCHLLTAGFNADSNGSTGISDWLNVDESLRRMKSCMNHCVYYYCSYTYCYPIMYHLYAAFMNFSTRDMNVILVR
jgi:hypothetical protein